MDEQSSNGDDDHHQPKKSKLSADHDTPGALTAEAEEQTSNPERHQLLSSSSAPAALENQRRESKHCYNSHMERIPDCATVSSSPNAVEEAELMKMNIEDEPTPASDMNDAAISPATSSTASDITVDSQRQQHPRPSENVTASDPERPEANVAAASAAEPVAMPAVESPAVRPRNRFRGRNYRLRSISPGSEHGADSDRDMEEMIRRMVDEINQEGSDAWRNDSASFDDDADDNNDDDDDNEDEISVSTASIDSDDSDSSPAVSGDDNDDDDIDDSDQHNSDSNANEHVDVANLPFMQTANVKSNWNYFRETQLRALGLSYRTKASLGGVRYNSNQFQCRAYGSKYVVERLGLLQRLAKHSGCVNSLNFNLSGKLLASGSDDLKINLWNWQTNKLVQSITSGHQLNVFQTKFVEASGYRDEIEIISTGRDGQVRHTRVGPAGEVKRALLFKQSHPIHKIAIPARSPYEFLTACEDGVVKSYDLRDSVAKKVVNAKKRLYSIATHPLDNEFCVSGNDKSVFVYDRRHPEKPMKCHYAAHMKSREYITVTCAVYNHTGTEILASYSEEDVFLFDNVNHEDGKYLHKYGGHCNVKTIKGVNFFGPRSEFVVSGSDCGNIFFWDKESEIIVNWAKGDTAGVVNCLEPHPEFPIIATSGLDYDAKIWVPIGTDDEQEAPVFSRELLEKCVRRNLRIRYNHRRPPTGVDRILDFLALSRQGIGGRLRRHFSSDSEDQADGDGNGGGGASRPGGGRRADGDADDDDNDNGITLHCNPS